MRQTTHAHLTGNRRDIDYLTAAVFLHGLHNSLTAIERSVEISLHSPVPLLIRQFFGGADSAQNMHGAAAAAVLCVLPLIVAYLCLQKYFIQGQVDSAVK